MARRAQTAEPSTRLGDMAPIMGGALPITIAAWCRMFAPADIMPTAIGPGSRRHIVPANPAPLDIDGRRAPRHTAPDAQRELCACVGKNPAGAGQSCLGMA